MLNKGSDGVDILSDWYSGSKSFARINSDLKQYVKFTGFINHIDREYQRKKINKMKYNWLGNTVRHPDWFD